MNPRILPFLLAGLTAAAVVGCEPTAASPPEDDHAGHDHAEPAMPEASGMAGDHAEDDGHGHGASGRRRVR